MTKPTQAQIEAVRRTLQLSSCFGKEVCVMLPCACAETLTATAQVGESDYEDMKKQRDFAIAAHDGQVHEKVILSQMLVRDRAVTIERCKQVAENLWPTGPGKDYGKALAAALDKLKDAP